MFAIRERGDDFTLLVDNYARLKPHIALIHPKATAIIDYHQRPLTIIYENTRGLPESALGENSSIGPKSIQNSSKQLIMWSNIAAKKLKNTTSPPCFASKKMENWSFCGSNALMVDDRRTLRLTGILQK